MKNDDMYNKDTRMLLDALEVNEDYGEFLTQNEQFLGIDQFTILLRKFGANKNILPSDIIDTSRIERSYGYQIINGTRKPSRDKIIQLSFGLSLTLDETNQLLKSADKQPLYAKLKRDSVIIYALIHAQTIESLNNLLFQNDLQPLY